MDAKRAQQIAAGFIDGAFAALGALLGAKFKQKAGVPTAADAGMLAKWTETHPVWLHARIEGGGAAALLLTNDSAASLVARVGGEDPAKKAAVSAGDSAVLQELCETMIGGGLSGLAAVIGGASMDQAAFSIGEAAAALTAKLGAGLTGAEVSFEDETGRGNAVLIFTDALGQRASGVEGPLVSDEEMKDILKDFTPDDEADHTARGNGGPLPDNLDVVMDIELVATARLGRVEVPIAEVLNYGPGSIIELGHVVDEPIELLVNGKLIARGDVVVVDERFGLRITEIVSPRERIESLR